jgi:macrocin-O-methyltransferase TylF-like protien
MVRNTIAIPTASHFLEHITMATQIMKIPRSIHGCIVECGCYAGGSTANLSLACALTGRRLEVFDSFKGLPNLPEQDRTYTVLNVQEGRHRGTSSPGDWSTGLEVVKTNVSRWGNIEVCEFNAGYFDEVLPGFSEACVFIFLDVDLRSSLETCVEHLWPLLLEGCYLFMDGAKKIELVSLFFDNAWWQKTLGMSFPGCAGADSVW